MPTMPGERSCPLAALRPILWASITPLRYRGYVYDEETGLYYLQSRYYNPQLGRFISADDISYLGVDGSVVSYNLFAYCNNNPVRNAHNSVASNQHISGGIIKPVNGAGATASNSINLNWLAVGLDNGSTIHGLYTSISGAITHLAYFAKNTQAFADDMTMLGASMNDGVLAFNQFSWSIGKLDGFGVFLGTGLDIYDSVQRGVSPGGIILGATLTTAKGVGLIYLNKGILYGATAIGGCFGPVGAVAGFAVGVVICIAVDIHVSDWMDRQIDKIAK